MALTVTTDLTVLSTAESVTGWVSYGSGGAGAMAIEPDFSVHKSGDAILVVASKVKAWHSR